MIDIERKAIDYANSKGYFGESPSMLRSMSYICIIDGFIEGYKRALTDSSEGIKSNPEDNRNTPEEFIDKLRKRQIEQNDLNNRIDEIKREYDNARDLSEDLYVYDSKHVRDDEFYELIIPNAFKYEIFDFNRVKLPSDADERLIGRHITWNDEPIELK